MASDWLTIATRNRMEALMIKGLLEASGLPVRLQGEALGELYGFNTGPLGAVQVQVPAEAASQARAILAAAIGEETAGGE